MRNIEDIHLIPDSIRTTTSTHQDHCLTLVIEFLPHRLFTHRPETFSYSSCRCRCLQPGSLMTQHFAGNISIASASELLLQPLSLSSSLYTAFNTYRL